MTDTSWTPGPWKRSEHAADRIEGLSSLNGLARSFGGIASVYGVPNNCGYSEVRDDTRFREGNANAHLIAAAPELYEALENILAVYRGDGGTKPNAHEMCHAVLAKARGESPPPQQ